MITTFEILEMSIQRIQETFPVTYEDGKAIWHDPYSETPVKDEQAFKQFVADVFGWCPGKPAIHQALWPASEYWDEQPDEDKQFKRLPDKPSASLVARHLQQKYVDEIEWLIDRYNITRHEFKFVTGCSESTLNKFYCGVKKAMYNKTLDKIIKEIKSFYRNRKRVAELLILHLCERCRAYKKGNCRLLKMYHKGKIPDKWKFYPVGKKDFPNCAGFDPGGSKKKKEDNNYLIEDWDE